VAVTAAFKTSAALTIAYGVAVCVVMLISTYFFCCVAYYRWKKPIRQILPFLIIFGVIDVVFLAANLQKIEYGGWFPLTVSFILTMIMIFWNNGQELLSKALRDHCLSDEDVTTALKDALAVRVSGTGLFFTPDGGGIPAAITQLIRRLHILPERVVFVYIRAVDAPFVRPNEGLRTSLETQMKAKGVYKAIATFGYAQEHIEATIIAKDIITEIQRIEQTSVDVFREKKELPAFDIPLVKSKLATEGEIIYFTSRDSIASRKEYSGNPVRQFIHDLFVAAYTVLSRNAPDMATYYQIPENELIEIGTRYLV
jgi:KUP system potassium uptake protein